MDFRDTDDTPTPSGDTAQTAGEFPAPEVADADALEAFNARWLESHPNATRAASGDDDPTVELPYTAKGADIEGTRYKSEFPWLYDTGSKGAQWDFDPIELRTLAQENAWVEMMVQTIVKEIAETSWTIVSTDDEPATETQKRVSALPGERDPIEKDLPDATAERIFEDLREPNPDHDWTDVVEMWGSDLLEIGSMAGVKAFDSRAYNDDEEFIGDPETLVPDAVQPTAPEVWTKDYRGKTGLVDGYWQFARRSTPGSTGHRSRGSSSPTHFDRDEVLWTDHSPRSNRRYGISPTLLVSNTLQSIDLAQTQEQQYLSRGSIPSGAWVFEEWDREAVKEWKTENQENLKGKPHKSLMFAGRGGDVKFEPMSMNFQELEFTDRMKWYARVIAAAFQVPTAVVGVEPERVNYSTFKGERANFESNTLGPYLQQFERFINRQWVQLHWDGYRFEFVPGMSESTRGMIMDRVTTGFSNNLITRNEARRELGKDAVDGAEEGFKDDVTESSDEGGLDEVLGNAIGKAEYEVGDETIAIDPPEYMIAAAEAAADAGERGVIGSDCGTGRGDDRRDQILDDAVGPDVVDEMATYLTSHAEDVTAEGHPRSWSDDEWGDCGNAQYAKWGGVGDGRAMEWAQRKSDEVADARGEEPTYKAVLPVEKEDASERPLRNTDDFHEFDVQPEDVDALYSEIAPKVREVFEEALADERIEGVIESLATAETDGSDATEKSTLDILRRLKDIIADVDVAEEVADAIQQHTTESMSETLDRLAADVDADVDPDPIVQALGERDVAFADSFADRMADSIRDTVADGWEAGKNSAEIRDDIQDQADSLSDWGAERIARQELHVATGEARQEFASEAGKVEVWETAGDDRVRDAHEAMDGTWKRPGDAWEVEYPDRGTKEEKVQGDSEPGIGCRCTTLLVDRSEVDEDDYGGVNGP